MLPKDISPFRQNEPEIALLNVLTVKLPNFLNIYT